MNQRFLGAGLLLAALLVVVTACTQTPSAQPTRTVWPTTAVQPTPRPTATDARGIQRPGPTAAAPYDVRDLVRAGRPPVRPWRTGSRPGGAGDGTLYAAALDGAYRLLPESGEWQRLPGQPTGADGAPLPAGCLLVAQGHVFIGYDRQTLGIWDGAALRTLALRSDPRGAVFALAADPAERTLYVGSHTHVQEAPLAAVLGGGKVAWATSAPADFAGQPQLIYALAATDQALFLGNQEGAWVRRDSQWQRISQVQNYVNCVRRTALGVVIGAPPGLLVSADDGRTWAAYPLAAPADQPDYPDDVLVTDRAVYAAAVSSGLYVWARDAAGRPEGTGQLVRAGIPECLAADAAGGLWLGDHAGLRYVPGPAPADQAQRDAGGAPGQSGPVPGAAPGQPGPVPGAVPGQPGPVPGAVPGQPGPVPGQPSSSPGGVRPATPQSKAGGLAAPAATPPYELLGQGPGCPPDLRPGCALDCVPDGYDTELYLKIYAADTGAPLAGVIVEAWQYDNDDGYHDLGTSVTGADGRVHLIVNCNWGVELRATPPDLTLYQAREGGIGGKWAGLRNGCTCYPCMGLPPVPRTVELPDDLYYWCPPTVQVGWEPPYPVVVGQDPERVGVTVIVTATVHDVQHVWFTCSAPLVDGRCPEGRVVTHTEWIPDALDVSGLPPNTRAALDLTDAAEQYIKTTLAERYPGVKVYRKHWGFPLTFVFLDHNVAGGCPGQRFVAQQHFPLADPGDYYVTVRVTTLFPPENLRGTAMEDGRLLPAQALSVEVRKTLHVLFVRQRLEQ